MNLGASSTRACPQVSVRYVVDGYQETGVKKQKRRGPTSDAVSGAPKRSRGPRDCVKLRAALLTCTIVLAAQSGITLLTYPSAAAWVSQVNQSKIVNEQASADSRLALSAKRERLRAAQEYNAELGLGPQLLRGADLPSGAAAAAETSHSYWNVLNSGPTNAMARLRIPSIDLDLPVYHGTSEETLLLGIGHLEGTALPIGGEGHRTVLTGHRGLSSATMFTRLDELAIGDDFSVEVLGEVITYQVFDVSVVAPDSTTEIRPELGRDLATLVTCTPLGINSHRILVTGERVLPAPAEALQSAGSPSEEPGFPWWALTYLAASIGSICLAGARQKLVAPRGRFARTRERRERESGPRGTPGVSLRSRKGTKPSTDARLPDPTVGREEAQQPRSSFFRSAP